MSRRITVTAYLDVADVRTLEDKAPRWIATGPVYVEVGGPTDLVCVDHDGRRTMIDEITRAIRLKFATWVVNHELARMLQNMAARIEGGAQAGEVLAPLLTGEIERALRGKP